MTMDLYTSVMEQKKTEDMKLLEDTIGLDKVNENSTVRNNKLFSLHNTGDCENGVMMA